MTQLFASSLPGPNLASWAKLCFLGQNCCSMGKTEISRGRFPGQIRDPLIRSKNHSNRFRYRIRRIFPDFFPNPFFPEKIISGREFRYSVSVGTGISRSRFHPYTSPPLQVCEEGLSGQVKVSSKTAQNHSISRFGFGKLRRVTTGLRKLVSISEIYLEM